MKKPSKNIWKRIAYIAIIIIGIVMLFDLIVLPFYVSGKELKVPNVVGMNKDRAIEILKDADLIPIVKTSRYDEKYKKDQVVFQKPNEGSLVKGGRRVYLSISGGDPLVQVPFLINKTVRDARMSLERLGLTLGNIDSVESESPVNTIVEQQYFQGRDIAVGSSVSVKVSIGPQLGMVRVPRLIEKSLTEAEIILKLLSLRIGYKTYISSNNWLPNTVVDQQPSENSLVKLGDSVNVVLTQSK